MVNSMKTPNTMGAMDNAARRMNTLEAVYLPIRPKRQAAHKELEKPTAPRRNRPNTKAAHAENSAEYPLAAPH